MNQFWRSPVLKIPDFTHLLVCRGLVAFALQIQAVIVGWQIYQLKGGALLLGMIGLTEAIPAITAAFFAGHVVDSSRPAIVFRNSLGVILLNTMIIGLAVVPQLDFSVDLRVGILFLGIFISGAARAFTSPAMFSLVPQIVPRESIPQAAATNSSVFTLAQILGPALGGLCYGALGPQLTFALPCLFAAMAVLSSLRFSAPMIALHSRPPGQSAREPMWQSIRAGMTFLAEHKILLSTMLLDMFSVLFGGAVAVLPIFADQIFKVGSSGLGLLRAAPAVGSVLISLWLSYRPLKNISGSRLLLVVAGFGVCMICFGLTKNFSLALLFLAVSGIFDGMNMIIRGTITQLLTPDHMRGRVSSLGSIFITSSNEIGAFESGVAATSMGLVPSVVFGGIMTLLVVAIINWQVPNLRKTVIAKDTAK